MTTKQRMTAREEAWRIVAAAPLADVMQARHERDLGIPIDAPTALHRAVEQAHGIDLTPREQDEVTAIFSAAVMRRAVTADIEAHEAQ